MPSHETKPGRVGWEAAWENLERAGNIGIQYCINPVLYPAIASSLLQKRQATMVDFGAGTNSLGYELLFAKAKQVPGLLKIPKLAITRSHIKRVTGLEQSKTLVCEAKTNSPRLIIKEWDLRSSLPLKGESIDLAVSRNFIMHLSIPELKDHLADVANTLKPGGEYIFSTLNPNYEVRRNSKWGDVPLRNGKRYEFVRGSMKNTLFMHYFKTPNTLEKLFNKNFTIATKLACFPTTTKFRHSHERYYWKNCPIAYVYKLVKHD